MSRIRRNPGFASNATAGGSAYSDIARALHEQLENAGGIFSDWILHGPRKPIKRNGPFLPVGMGGVSVLESGNVLSEVSKQAEIVSTATTVDPAIDRRDLPPTEVLVQPMIETIDDPTGRAFSNTVQQQMVAEGWTWTDGVWSRTVTETADPVVAPTTTTTTTGGSMDLGALVTDLATTYIQTKYAPTSTPTVQTVDYTIPGLGLNVDPLDLFTDPVTGVVTAATKKKCKRRRRKRLATKSDIADLAALKAILGNGESFKTWIATHA